MHVAMSHEMPPGDAGGDGHESGSAGDVGDTDEGESAGVFDGIE